MDETTKDTLNWYNSAALKGKGKSSSRNQNNIKTHITEPLVPNSNKSSLGYKNTHYSTALICACKNKMVKVAINLIETSKSNPGHVDNDGNTALIWTCRNKMEKVAIILIETGKSNPEHVDDDGNTALIWHVRMKWKK